MSAIWAGNENTTWKYGTGSNSAVLPHACRPTLAFWAMPVAAAVEPATVSLAAGSYTDAALNLGGAGSDSVTIDTENPTVVVNIVDGALSDGDNNSLVTFASSEAPGASFTESDIHEPGWGNKPAVFEGKRTAWLIDGKTGEPPVVAGARL